MLEPEPSEQLWTIGPETMVNTYSSPTLLGNVAWRVGESGQAWPLYHPSEADPEAGYRLHPYTVVFTLPEAPEAACLLRVAYLTIAPRLADLEIEVNGTAGRAYLRPKPSESGEIRLHAGLHSSIYSEGVAEVVVPAGLLREGENRLTLTARDDGEVLRVEHPEAVKRLDRMANGAGLVYQGLEFLPLERPTELIAGLEIVPSPLYRRGENEELLERCDLYLELGGRVAATELSLALEWGGRTTRLELPLPATEFGHLRLPFELPDGEGEVGYRLEGRVNGRAFAREGSFRRRRKWTVYATPHAHVDIGYTHRQWEVAERMCRNIDDALEQLERDKGFGYHLDCAWPLETYRATREPERWARLEAAIREGRIGVSGLYGDLLTNLAGLEDLVRNSAVAADLIAPATTDFAAIVDVASLSGSLPTVLEGAGVRYLVHADNQDRGPFRLNGGLHRRSPFRWEGAGGGSVLVWLAKMYCELRKVCGSPPVLASAERGLSLWLEEFDRSDYPGDAVLLYGQEADNTDLDPQPADFVRRWNEAYAYPRLVSSTPSDFFRHVEASFAQLPTFRGDGGAYWEDGAGSSLEATIWARQAQASLPAAERLEALAVAHGAGLAYPGGLYDAAWRDLLFYDEHTWGAFLSATEPDARLALDQWAVKENFARQARLGAERLLHVAATRHGLSWGNNGREVVIYNPHSWPVSEAVMVEVEPDEVPVDPTSGEALPARRAVTLPSQTTLEFWVDGLKGLSYRRFPLERRGGVPEDEVLPVKGPVVLENDRHRLTLEPGLGCAVGWLDKRLGRELVDPADPHGLGRFLYARGGEGTRLVSNRHDLPDGNPEVIADFDLIEATRRRSVLGQSLALRGTVEGGELTIEWNLPERADWVDVRYSYRKESRRAKEAVYVAFPLALPEVAVRSDSQLGWVDWDRDTLPGACQEWLPLQSGVLASGEGISVLVCSPDIPLFCVGDIVRGRWPVKLPLCGGRLYSYVLNNYWHTNYKAEQGGELTWRYRLASGARLEPAEAHRRGWTVRQPPYAQRLSFQDFRETRAPYENQVGGTLARLSSPGNAVVLSTLKGARVGEGLVARLQEIGGEDRTATLAFAGRPIARAWSTDLLERDREELEPNPDGNLTVGVPAWGLTTVRLVLDFP